MRIKTEEREPEGAIGVKRKPEGRIKKKPRGSMGEEKLKQRVGGRLGLACPSDWMAIQMDVWFRESRSDAS